MNLVWLPLALRLRFAQLDHVAKENPQAAVQLDEEIEAQADLLMTHPEMGRTGRKEGTRELVIQRTPYILVYRVRPQAKRVEILRVLHGAQQWPLPKAKVSRIKPAYFNILLVFIGVSFIPFMTVY